MNEPRGFAALAALWHDASRRRKLASLGIALALEGLILLVLLTLGASLAGDPEAREKVTTFKAQSVAEAPAPQPEQNEESPEDSPQPDQPVTTPVAPMRPSPLALNPQPALPQPPQPPQPEPEPEPSPTAAPARPKSTIGARIRPNSGYGPVDTGNPRTVGDSEMVGTMPNGEPLYRARWYREPTEQELLGYLSTATGPGYALIACRVVQGYYVEDCQFISEGPQGSQIGRAVLAAAWQFRVRPARVGGREQFGTWVRIRIDYTERRERR
ncbi:MAG: hypothetical protein KAF27_02625 [Porphyrobacter sp.]|nr:hypothetical protein [Porphyrobacter sp.]